MKLRCLLLRRKAMTNLDRHIRKRRHHFTNKAPSSQSYGFSSSHVRMWELDHKESWAPRNWYFWTVVLEKTFESPLDFKKTQWVRPKGDQSWIFIGRTDAEAEFLVLWPPDVKSQLIRKDPDAGKDWRQRRRGRQMMGWLDGITNSMDMSEQTLGDGWRIGKPSVLQRLQGWTRLSNWATTYHMCQEPLWEIPPMTRSWGEDLTLKAIQDTRNPPGWPRPLPHPVSSPLFCCCSCSPCCRFLCCLLRALLLLFHWIKTNLKP